MLSMAVPGAGGYKVETDEYSLVFPGEPTKESSVVPTDVGDITMFTLMYEKSVDEVYMLAYSDYPVEDVSEADSESLLDGGKDGALKSLGISGTETNEEIEISGHPGIRFTGNNGQFYVNYIMVLAENRLYQVAILRDGSYASSKKTKKFFKSFKLAK